jgi:hypothetical protein
MAPAYAFKSSFFADAHPQRVGERLEQLRQSTDGILDAVDVVVDARATDSPLHRCFEWDDRKAAHEHRVETARQLIKAVVVSIPDGDGVVPAFAVAATSDDKRPKFVRKDKVPAFAMPQKTRQDRINEAYAELRRFRSRFAELDELGPLMRAIDLELQELERAGAAIESDQ